MFRKAIFAAGCILLIFSIFAKQLGIDNDEGWGMGRIAILVVALTLILAGFLTIYYPAKSAAVIQTLSDRKHLLAAVMVVTLIYIWTSQQNARHAHKDYKYYSELARSFKMGQLHLAEKPSTALLALADPYDYDLRLELKVEDFPWDVSLYQEKFFLYYGPIPALMLSVLSDRLLLQIGDNHLVLVFAFGLFIYGALILLKFFGRSLPNAPGWLVGLSVLTFGLTAPTAIMLLESRLYQVAVFGAQFFFIGGCYWIYSAITENRLNMWKLGLVGVHWALAIGTRISIAPIILYAAAVAILCIFILYKTSIRGIILPVLSIGTPLFAAALGLAWYNYARFNSILEFGLIYTLTDVNYPKANDIFALKHIKTNFYNYFIHPLRLAPRYPYLFRIEYRVSNERLGGLLYIAPYTLFALLAIVLSGRRILAENKLPNLSTIRMDPELWLLMTSAGSAIIGVFTILSFWTVQLRYTQDFMPSLLLFATINVVILYRTLEDRALWRRLFSVVIVLFASITVIASTLVALKTNSLSFWTNLADTILRILNLK